MLVIKYTLNVYFGLLRQDIEEVYVDHLRVPKGASSSLSFCVKARSRTLSLLAPSAPALRIWVEVIFTGAEGYDTYMQ